VDHVVSVSPISLDMTSRVELGQLSEELSTESESSMRDSGSSGC
jgi:hypothetical protein